MNKGFKNIILGIVVVFIILIGIKFLLKKEPDRELDKYVTKLGFVREEDSSLYFKRVSNIDKDEFEKMAANGEKALFEGLYFNIDTCKLTKDMLEYDDEMLISFNPTYDYLNETLEYDYRVNIRSSSVIIGGTYDLKSEEFTCTPTYYYQFNINDTLDDICNNIKYETEHFSREAITLITRVDLINKLKKK